jgi:hypothetical protein
MGILGSDLSQKLQTSRSWRQWRWDGGFGPLRVALLACDRHYFQYENEIRDDILFFRVLIFETSQGFCKIVGVLRKRKRRLREAQAKGRPLSIVLFEMPPGEL